MEKKNKWIVHKANVRAHAIKNKLITQIKKKVILNTFK